MPGNPSALVILRGIKAQFEVKTHYRVEVWPRVKLLQFCLDNIICCLCSNRFAEDENLISTNAMSNSQCSK